MAHIYRVQFGLLTCRIMAWQKVNGFCRSYARDKNRHSIKADTNFDNVAILSIFEKIGYRHCGEVYFGRSSRRAPEKILK